MTPPEIEKDRPERPASDSLLVHIVDEMPMRVVFAITFVAFFFTWGAVNNIMKLFADPTKPTNTSIGVYAGLLVAVATPIVIWRIKRRSS